MDLYKVLGVRRDATEAMIRRAYHKIARSSHPDTHPDDHLAVARFRAATKAYEILIDPAKRAVYDRESRPVASLQDLLTRPVGEQALSSLVPHAPAARRNGQDQIVCLPEEDGHVTLKDPNDPATTIRIPTSSVHRFVRVARFGALGAGGGSPGTLYVLPQQEKT